ncbi:uncharacterized protein G2W53_043202 [Senna tora]|uniref:Uncharacterized protein n=1 Tax=Senna tora TaxID=362788 RepID=A0A834SI96_9FABA|nr:uncharacterized protein G2W53_043202 [Senna tora]
MEMRSSEEGQRYGCGTLNAREGARDLNFEGNKEKRSVDAGT